MIENLSKILEIERIQSYWFAHCFAFDIQKLFSESDFLVNRVNKMSTHAEICHLITTKPAKTFYHSIHLKSLIWADLVAEDEDLFHVNNLFNLLSSDWTIETSLGSEERQPQQLAIQHRIVNSGPGQP